MLPPPRPPPPPPTPPVPAARAARGVSTIIHGPWMKEDGRSARLRHCTGHVHASILFCWLCWHTQTGTHQHHTIRAASPTTLTARPATPLECIQYTRDRPGGVLRTYEATPPVSTKFSVSNDAAKRSKRPACSARQRKRVQELAAARAAHYDGICLARWRRISVARAR